MSGRAGGGGVARNGELLVHRARSKEARHTDIMMNTARPHPPWGGRPPPQHIQDTGCSQRARTQPQRQAAGSKIPESMH